MATALRRAGRGGRKRFWWVIQLLYNEYGRGGGAGSATSVAWERKAVLIRTPVEVAQRLADAAQRENRSVSEHSAAVLAQVLSASEQE